MQVPSAPTRWHCGTLRTHVKTFLAMARQQPAQVSKRHVTVVAAAVEVTAYPLV